MKEDALVCVIYILKLRPGNLIHLSHIFPTLKHLLALLRVCLRQSQDVVMATQIKNHNRHE